MESAKDWWLLCLEGNSVDLQTSWSRPYWRSMGENDQVRAPNIGGPLEGTSERKQPTSLTVDLWRETVGILWMKNPWLQTICCSYDHVPVCPLEYPTRKICTVDTNGDKCSACQISSRNGGPRTIYRPFRNEGSGTNQSKISKWEMSFCFSWRELSQRSMAACTSHRGLS